MPGILSLCFAKRLITLRLINLLFFACLANPVHAGSLTVSVVLSDSSQPYQQFSAEFHKYFAENYADVVVVESYADEKPKVNRSEEHTSELQSPKDLVCRLLLEKKKE